MWVVFVVSAELADDVEVMQREIAHCKT